MDTKGDRFKAALQKRIDELKDAQLKRASIIEKALVRYEKSIRIRSVSDYIALANFERRCIGLSDSKVEHTGKDGGPIEHRIDLSNLSDEDLSKLERILEKVTHP